MNMYKDEAEGNNTKPESSTNADHTLYSIRLKTFLRGDFEV